MSRTNKPTRVGRDFYQTPIWVIDCLVETLVDEPINPNFIIDAGCGDGRIGTSVCDVVKATNRFVDIDTSNMPEGLDAIESDFPLWMNTRSFNKHHTIWIVSNPPYNQAMEFVRSGHEAISKQGNGSLMACLLRLDWLGSKKRSDWLSENKPTFIGVLTPRPKFVVGQSTDSGEYAWIMWHMHPETKTRFEIFKRDD